MAEKNKPMIREYHLNENRPDQPQLVVYDLNDYLRKDTVNTSKAHIHSFYQIIWFKGGRGKHFVDFKEYEVFDNVIFFVAQNQVHYFDQNIRYDGVLIHFNDTFLLQKNNEIALSLKFDLFTDPYRQPFCQVSSDINDVLNEYIFQMKRELGYDNEYGKQELLRLALLSFLIQIQRQKSQAGKNIHGHGVVLSEKKTQLLRFMNLVEEHYGNGLAVSEYARLLFISSRHLSELKSQLLGKTPSHIIRERLVLEAKRLLLHSSLNISEIAYRLGFEDPSYFVKYFKKHSDVSPSAFRRSAS